MTDREAELEARIAALEEQLREDRRPSAVVDNAVRAVLPDETRRHMRAAWREQLLAVRSILDHWIERQAPEPAKRDRGHESIRID